MTTPEIGLAARLAEFAKSDCRDNEFAKWCQTAWTAYSLGQLITLADHTRLVKEAVDAEREAIAAFIETHAYTVGTERKMEPSKQAINDMHHATIAASIRAREATK